MGTRIHILPLAAALAAAAALLAPAAASASCAGYAKPVQFPPTAPEPKDATEYSRIVSAEEAAKLGQARGSTTGGVSGENVRLDPSYANLDAPVRVKMNIEVIPPDGTPPGKPSDEFAAKMKADLQDGLKKAEAVGGAGLPPGQRLVFDINVKVRGPAPTPGYHQVKIVGDPDFRSVSGITSGNGAGSAVWSNNNADGSWTHEALHLMGLTDRYDDYFIPRKGKGSPEKLPSRGMTDREIAKYLKGLKPPLTLSDGKCKSKETGSKDDIMSNSEGLNEGAGINKDDRDTLVRRGANAVTVVARPGDLLGNKEASAQNYGVGGGGEVTVQNPSVPGATASQADEAQSNGIVVYCIDAHKSAPSAGQGLDVLGQASQIPTPGMQALQRVLEVAARHQPAPGQTTPGAQAAIWRVTDNQPVGDDADALAILAEAGVAPEGQFEEHHFTNPNAGSPLTGSISPSGAPAPRVLPPKPPSFVKGAALQSKRVRVRRGRRAGVRLRVGLDVVGSDERVRAAIVPPEGKPQLPLETFEPRKVRAGRSTLKLSAPWLRPGRYTLVVSGSTGDRTLPFTVRRAPRRR